VYDFFEPEMVQPVPQGPFDKWYVSCDYGTVNPTSMGLWGRCCGIWYRVKEFYFSSRREQRQMTDEEYARALQNLVGERQVTAVIVDPSAASFIEVLRRRGWRVQKADNDVLSGIRLTSDALKEGRIVICEGCPDCLREMDEYVWDLAAGNKDRVKKEHDHAMDDMRYFVSTVLKEQGGGFVALSVERRR
jgi:PBSX family phage terminase large subunit